MTDEPIKVGDRLWYVPHHGAPFAVTVARIGRKWITAGAGWGAMRFDRDTLVADGGNYSSPGQAYRSREEYLDSCARFEGWIALQRDFAKARPPFPAVDKIAEARRLLFGED